ncbi:hypothetical protein LCGC14_2615820, partial [marine sediment metagenome]
DTRLISPDGNDVLWIANNDLTFYDGIRDRIVADAAGTRLYSTGVNASYIACNDVAIYLNDGARARVQVDDNDTYLFSPSGTKWVDVDNSGVALQGDTTITGKTEIVSALEFLKITADEAGAKRYMAWYGSNGTTREAWLGFGSGGNYEFTIFNEKADNHILIKTTGTGTIVLQNLPTSSAGLPTGGLWKSSGYLRIA